jgi:hypothetical protein
MEALRGTYGLSKSLYGYWTRESMAGMVRRTYKARMAWILILGFGTLLFVGIDVALAVSMVRHIIEPEWYGLGIPAACACASYQAMRRRIGSTKPPKFGL